VGGVLFVALLILGAITPSSKKSSPTGQSTSSKPTRSSRPALPKGQPSPAHSSSATTSTGSALSARTDGMTGYGATDIAWNAHHRPDPDFDPSAVYNRDPALPQVNGHTGADYTEVSHQAGRVLQYDLHFPNLPVAEAKASVFGSEFPRDARQVWFAVKDACAQMLVRSRTLARALGTKAIGSKNGTVLVEFGSSIASDHYTPSRVGDALFMLGQDTSPDNAPGC